MNKIDKQIKTRIFSISSNNDINKDSEEIISINIKNSYGELEKTYRITDINMKIRRITDEINSLQKELISYKKLKKKIQDIIKEKKLIK